jgi:hypothetical protein
VCEPSSKSSQQSSANKESRGGSAGATMGAFLGLAPTHLVSVKPALITAKAKTNKGKYAIHN